MVESNKNPMTQQDLIRDVAMPNYDEVDEMDELEDLPPIGHSTHPSSQSPHHGAFVPPVVNKRDRDADDATTPMDDTLEGRIAAALRTVYDPEIPVDIYELGLIYDIEVDPDFFVLVRMTLTTPNCPEAGRLPGEVEDKVRSVDGVMDCKVEIVWDPPWNPSYMSEAAKLELGMF